MNARDFELGNGQVVHWDLDQIDPDRPVRMQLDQLKEDLAQVRYGGVLLDVGWYPEFAANGSFTVTAVKNEDWEQPLFIRECSDISALVIAVAEAARVARQA